MTSPQLTRRQIMLGALAAAGISLTNSSVVASLELASHTPASNPFFDRTPLHQVFKAIIDKHESFMLSSSRWLINDEYFRFHWRVAMEGLLHDLRARELVYDSSVMCDERNNPPILIEEGGYHASAWVKPTRTVETYSVSFGEEGHPVIRRHRYGFDCILYG